MTLLWDPRLSQLGVTIRDCDKSLLHWKLLAAWLTVNGSWDDVPDWARQWQLDTLGGAQHSFGRALDQNGDVCPTAGFMLKWPGMTSEDQKWRLPHADGWANDELWNGYDWAQTSGPYSWNKAGNADVLCGLGLPYPPLPWQPSGVYAEGGVHVSYFAVWQESSPEQEPEPVPSCWDYLGLWWKCITGRL